MNYINIRGIRLHYIQQGKGKDIILLHGLPGFCYDFRYNIPILSKNFRITAIDFKGFGHSEKREYSLEEFRCDILAKEIIEAIEELDIRNFVLLGHDIGSIVSQLIAQEVNCNLVLINPAYKGMRGRWREIANEYWYIFFHQTPIAEKMIYSNYKDYINYFIDHLTVNKFKDEEKEEYFKVYQDIQSIKALVNWYRAYVRYFRWSDIKEIRAKTLIIWSDSDPLFPYSWTDKLGEEFKDYELVKISNAGHWPHIEKSEEVNNTIIKFVNFLN
jgi:pimeloyl-ACP methyl ester carboxylesterase